MSIQNQNHNQSHSRLGEQYAAACLGELGNPILVRKQRTEDDETENFEHALR